jgi:hypothetical protein
MIDLDQLAALLDDEGGNDVIFALLNAAPELLRLAKLGQAYVLMRGALTLGADDTVTDAVSNALDDALLAVLEGK